MLRTVIVRVGATLAPLLVTARALAQADGEAPAPSAPSTFDPAPRSAPIQAEPPAASPPATPAETPATGAGDPADGATAPRPQAGFYPDQGFVLRTEDERYKLKIGFQAAIRGQVIFGEGKPKVSGPFLTLRPNMGGNIYKKWIRYYASLELAANPVYLLDTYVEIQPCDAFGVDVGQQSTPFSRHEFIFGPHQLLFPEWNMVADYFWTGRDKGVTVFGSALEHKLEWWIGGYLGTPLRQFDTIRGNYQFIARLAVNPAGPVGNTEFAYAEKDRPAPFRYSMAVNGFVSKLETAIENFNPSTFKFDTVPSGNTTVNRGLGADFFLQSSRVMALIEGYVRRTDPRDGQPDYTSVGAWGQVGTLLYKRDLDASLRVTWADVNVARSGDQGFGGEIASNYYIHAPNLALKLRYGFGHQAGDPDATASGGARLLLPPGDIHVVTAQINASF